MAKEKNQTKTDASEKPKTKIEYVTEPVFVVRVTRNYKHPKSGTVKTRTLARLTIASLKDIPTNTKEFVEKFTAVTPEARKEKLLARMEKLQREMAEIDKEDEKNED